jgi:DNA-binding CsgD family transcriptional regulator
MQLLGINPTHGAILFSHTSDGSQDRAHVYIRDYQLRDPRLPLLLRKPMGDWLLAQDDCGPAFHDKHAEYRDNLDGFGGGNAALLKLADGRDEIVLALVWERADGAPFDTHQRAYLARIGLHLREALPTYRRLKRMAGEGVVGAGLIQRTSRAMALIDRDRRVAATNRAFDAVVGERRLFEVVDGLLQCPEAVVEKSLTLAMMELAAAMPRGDRTGVVPLNSVYGSVFALSVSAMASPESMQGFGAEPQVLLTAHQRPKLETVDTGAWQAAFRLSPAETKVAAHIFAGKAPKEVARALSVSPSTVKSQLDSIFAKTATTRQAELVRVLSTLSR